MKIFPTQEVSTVCKNLSQRFFYYQFKPLNINKSIHDIVLGCFWMPKSTLWQPWHIKWCMHAWRHHKTLLCVCMCVCTCVCVCMRACMCVCVWSYAVKNGFMVRESQWKDDGVCIHLQMHAYTYLDAQGKYLLFNFKIGIIHIILLVIQPWTYHWYIYFVITE